MVTPPDLPMTMKVYSATGAYIMEFPWFTNLQCLDCINDVGSFTFNWKLNSPNASSLISDSALQMAVCMDRRDGNGFSEVARYLYEQDTYDQSMPDSAIIQASGRSIIAILDQAIVYPQGGVGSTTTSYSFSGASPGAIMHTLITAAQARGCFPSLQMSFTSGQDSSGAAWTQGFTTSFDAGTSLLVLLGNMAQGGLVDFNMTGTTLNLYNPGTTLATDRSPSVFIRRGREVETLPAQRDRTQIGTAMLAIGDNGLNVERTASTLGSLGRYEKYLAQSGVTDSATLSFWADQALGAVDDQMYSYTPSYVCDVNKNTPIPWKDYFPGDYVSIDLTGTPVKFRARQIAVQCGVGGPTQVQPTLNDVFYDRNLLLQGKLNALNGGSVTGVGSPVTAPGPNPTVPGVPAFIPANIFTAAYYSPATGTTLAQLELSWTTPTNTDGSTMIDGMNYIVQYRLSTVPIYPIEWTQLQGQSWNTINGNPWTNPLDTPRNQQWTTVQVNIDDNTLVVGGLICGETYDFQIACTDVSGNTGLFSAISQFATARDNQAPDQPDAPIVSASMVAVQVFHDLQLAAGGPLPQDMDHLEVHYSYDPSFTPIPGVGSATYLGKLIANAGMINTGIPAVGTFQVTSTTNITIKVIAVDATGNISQASPGSGVTAVLIDDQHISSLSVSKLIAGTVTATIVLGGTIATALSGQRVVMDMNGFHAYDSSGNEIFDVSASSPVITLGKNNQNANSITLDTSSVFPTLYWNVPGGGHPAFINAVGSVTGSTLFGLNMGNYTSFMDNTTLASQRLYFTGVDGFQLAAIEANTQLPHGPGMGASFDTQFYMNIAEHGTEIGGIRGFLDQGVTPNDLYFKLGGYFQDVWNTSFPDPNSAIFFGAALANTVGTTGINFTYPSTMQSAPRIMAQYSCPTISPDCTLNVNQMNAAGFTISTVGTPPAVYNILFQGFRAR